MSVELPKDAEGREIPLDTKVLYDDNGEQIDVSRYQYYPAVGPDYWNIRSVRNKFYRTDEVHLTPPDSWEKLEEDLDRCVAENTICRYYSKDGTCRNCTISGTSDACSPKVLEDIKKRIRKLRGEDDA